ncbi:MAG TPA: NADH-quinone oxidoreductase subunit N [Verrucomicrobia bacterium]|nr:NADH-quinone oxidoreductase subunit N [Verrucomicrobiota bacterium]HOP99084.1 NADH-quinone oxidoreductase subunit N [Verrucomicrobiota bacterium]HPU54707.1 NADH-quinone oxidoreductase subunit N [Verrucomicrobiota bacterium]
MMNISLLSLELSVVLLGLALLLVDLWLPAERKRWLGYIAAAGLALLFLGSVTGIGPGSVEGTAFGNMFVQDALSLFFKRFFLLAGALVLVMAVEFSDRIAAGVSEYYALMLFALAGMLFASSANNFALLFVSLELITVTFYVLTSFQRARLFSLEAGVKYLIIGALSTAFTVYGIALVYGTTGHLDFDELSRVTPDLAGNTVFLFGLLFVMTGLGFKIAAFPFQIWAPDVYQGAPSPTTAFLAIGSKAAGFSLLLRVLFSAAPAIAEQWENLLITVSAVTILYGNLCALPQRNVKRLLGYSSIAHAGYLLLGVAALNDAGRSAVLFYLAGYLFTLAAAFSVISVVLRHLETEDISGLAGLSGRSPLLAGTMAVAMVSLAGIPPLAGFVGKFFLLKAVIERGAENTAYYWLTFIALAGVVMSLYYYFNVIRAMYWSSATDNSAIPVSRPMKWVICACIAGIFYVGLFPGRLFDIASAAVLVFHH